MNKLDKMRICDWSLIIILFLMLGSGIQLEVNEGSAQTWVWIHILIGTIFLFDIGWHHFEHFQWKNRIKKVIKQKSPVTKWLELFYLLTLISAVAALVYRLRHYTHSSLGGWHGKIGFIFLIFCIFHALKRVHSPILQKKK